MLGVYGTGGRDQDGRKVGGGAGYSREGQELQTLVRDVKK